MKIEIIMKKHHNLKTINPYFNDVWSGWKEFEVRINDRNFEVGDTCTLHEYDSEIDLHTGNSIEIEIKYVLRNYPNIKKGFVVFGFKIVKK